MTEQELRALKPDATVDARGTYCPVPIVLAKRELEQIRVGEILEVLADDAGILGDMPHWCKSTGQEYLGTLQEDGEFRTFVRRLK